LLTRLWNSISPFGIAHDGTASSKKNELKPHLSKYWKIPPEGSAAFVAAMEDVLEVYHLAYDPDYPVVCMDESCQLFRKRNNLHYPASRIMQH
jgi:hypothetical protein